MNTLKIIQKEINNELKKHYPDLRIQFIKNNDENKTVFVHIFNNNSYTEEVEVYEIKETELEQAEDLFMRLIEVFDFSYYLEFDGYKELDEFVNN